MSPSYQILKPGVSTQNVDIEIRNVACKDVTITRNEQLCHVFQARLVDSSDIQPVLHDGDNSHIKEIYLQPAENLDSSQVNEVKKLLEKWLHVFSLHDLDLGHATKSSTFTDILNIGRMKEASKPCKRQAKVMEKKLAAERNWCC